MSNITEVSFFAIDETISCIDKDKLDNVSRLFDYLRATYDYTLVITHIDTIQSHIDNSIHIRKINGESKLIN